jgi:hypothetical protein
MRIARSWPVAIIRRIVLVETRRSAATSATVRSRGTRPLAAGSDSLLAIAGARRRVAFRCPCCAHAGTAYTQGALPTAPAESSSPPWHAAWSGGQSIGRRRDRMRRRWPLLPEQRDPISSAKSTEVSTLLPTPATGAPPVSKFESSSGRQDPPERTKVRTHIAGRVIDHRGRAPERGVADHRS